MHSADYLVICLGDISGHVGRHVDRFDRVHGGYGVVRRNLECRILLELCLEKNYVCQVYGFRKRKGGR